LTCSKQNIFSLDVWFGKGRIVFRHSIFWHGVQCDLQWSWRWKSRNDCIPVAFSSLVWSLDSFPLQPSSSGVVRWCLRTRRHLPDLLKSLFPGHCMFWWFPQNRTNSTYPYSHHPSIPLKLFPSPKSSQLGCISGQKQKLIEQ